MSKNFNAADSLWCKGVEIFFSGGQEHRLEFPALSDLARNTLWEMGTSAASERVFSMAGHVVNSRRANLNSLSVNDIKHSF